MLSSRARAFALALLAGSVVLACGDDEVLPDGGGLPDASAADARIDSGDDLCPGELTFEALVADAESGEAVFAAAVAEVGAANQTTSAPNGRALLCLPDGAASRVSTALDDYLARLDTLSADAVERSYGTAQPYPIDILSTVEADDLLIGLGLTRDESASLLLVSVVGYPDGQPLDGAVVSIDKDSEGAFARDGTGQFATSPDREIGAGRLLLFANVAATGAGEDGQAAITVTPPDGFGGSCVGPPAVDLEIGGLSGAFFACQ
jgi:hypothetical protein